MVIYVHMDQVDALLQRLDRIERLLIQNRKEEHIFMADMKTELAHLTAQVKANEEAEASAIVLINGIADRITAAQGDPAQVAALAAELKDSADRLGAAVVANTPAA